MPTCDVELLLKSLKTFKVTKSHLVSRGLCNHSAPHTMRVRLLGSFVHNYASSHLRNNDILAAVTATIHEVAFTNNEEGGEAFTFAWENDADGRPIIGNGSDHKPFIIDMTTKVLLTRVDRDPGSFIFHIDATYKLCLKWPVPY
ncbi:hypothetical protein PPTG_21179 [Phytophthora nicotianae INRA-310]|uniref:Uncharacterized protein n=1 Tax=Phytophthora nicotianae (strain INRA-310) TaxID=761204 RepID=W2R383_PHYN3|nr:hypothetical protein PPTG_21179 [Phytophthora nicotianae INRA-310]ETN19828.1 hypothetical protein PPTG_21179 [Phytophthora nicotianae INRA-310]